MLTLNLSQRSIYLVQQAAEEAEAFVQEEGEELSIISGDAEEVEAEGGVVSKLGIQFDLRLNENNFCRKSMFLLVLFVNKV